MWQPRRNELKKGSGNGLIAVAIDKDKGSQAALKWAADNILSKGQTVILIHVVQKQNPTSASGKINMPTYIHTHRYIVYAYINSKRIILVFLFCCFNEMNIFSNVA